MKQYHPSPGAVRGIKPFIDCARKHSVLDPALSPFNRPGKFACVAPFKNKAFESILHKTQRELKSRKTEQNSNCLCLPRLLTQVEM